MLLGQSLDGMQVFDALRAIQAFRQLEGTRELPLWLQAERQMAGVALYAAIFAPNIVRVDLHDLPKTHRDGPIFLNVSRYIEMPQAVAMAATNTKVRIYQDDDAGWEYPLAAAGRLGWDAKQIQIRNRKKLPQNAGETKK
jgi:hypothetical protein